MADWLNDVWSTGTVKDHAATKKTELLIHTTTWMDLDRIMLNEKTLGLP